MMRMLWIGPAFPVAETLANPALAPAAARWQAGLFGGLVSAGCEVRAVGHRNHRIWPNGPVAVGRSATTLSNVPVIAVAHLNIPVLRDASVARQLIRESITLVESWGLPDVVASYNAPPPIADACRALSRRFHVPWIPFILDSDSPTSGWANIAASVRCASGVVFVSHWAFLNAPFARKLHLDSGVDAVPPSSAFVHEVNGPPAILYTGAMHRWGGVDMLLDAFETMPTTDACLWITGKGLSPTQSTRIAAMRRVTHFGVVSETQLDDLMRRAAVFANPRPVAMDGNEMNFPSKLLHYLSYMKPVVTTMTPGVAPEYADAVIPVYEDSAKAFGAALDKALRLADKQRKLLAEKVHGFLLTKLWSTQARRFLDWAHALIMESKG